MTKHGERGAELLDAGRVAFGSGFGHRDQAVSSDVAGRSAGLGDLGAADRFFLEGLGFSRAGSRSGGVSATGAAGSGTAGSAFWARLRAGEVDGTFFRPRADAALGSPFSAAFLPSRLGQAGLMQSRQGGRPASIAVTIGARQTGHGASSFSSFPRWGSG